MIQKTDTIERHLHKDNGIDDPSIYHHLVTEFLSSTFFQVIQSTFWPYVYLPIWLPEEEGHFGGKFACFEEVLKIGFASFFMSLHFDYIFAHCLRI